MAAIATTMAIVEVMEAIAIQNERIEHVGTKPNDKETGAWSGLECQAGQHEDFSGKFFQVFLGSFKNPAHSVIKQGPIYQCFGDNWPAFKPLAENTNRPLQSKPPMMLTGKRTWQSFKWP